MLSVALSACGEDGDGGGGASLAEFERRAAAACDRLMEATAERLPPEAVDPDPPPEALREQATVRADVTRSYREDLARLDLPTGLRDELDRTLTTLDELAGAYDDAAEAAGAGDADAARRAYNRAGTLGVRANRLFFDHARDAFCRF